MPELELAARIQQGIVIDPNGEADTFEIRGEDGRPKRVVWSKSILDRIDAGEVVLPDGTQFNRNVLQLAFQNALIAATGMCVLEHEYANAGYPDLAKLARNARGA